MSAKIVFLGGGSVNWTPRLVVDLFLEDSLQGSQLNLVDIDAQALDLVTRYLRRANEQLGCRWNLAATKNLDEALDGADVVFVSISTGGFEAMDRDYRIPEKYGVFHTVGDTVGAGGISRSLRNIPVFLDIAAQMEKHCPDAWMLHVTNPLTQLTRAVARETTIKVAGFCHEYAGTMVRLRDFFGLELYDSQSIDCLCRGVNHFTFLSDLAVKGIDDPQARMTVANYLDYWGKRKGVVRTGTTDDDLQPIDAGKTHPTLYLNFYLYERYGLFPLAVCKHVCESLPYFNSSEEILDKFHLGRKGVLPMRQGNKDRATRRIRTALEENQPIMELKQRSNESFCDVMVSLTAGVPRRVIAALPNIGQIDNLPRQAVVETWAMASRSGVHPVASGSVPMAQKAFLEQIIAEQELTVEAAVTGDRKMLEQALFASPSLHDKSGVADLAGELLAANDIFIQTNSPHRSRPAERTS